MTALPTRRQYQIFIDRSPDAVWDFFALLKNHPRLCPAENREEITSGLTNAPLELGERFTLQTRWSGAWKPLEAEVTEWSEPYSSVFTQTMGPYTSWLLRRKLTPFQTGTLFAEIVEYRPAPGPMGVLAEKLWLGPQIEALFTHRQKEAKRILENVGRIKGR